jgi:hypothetical protein
MVSDLTRIQVQGIRGSLPTIVDTAFVIYKTQVEELKVSSEEKQFNKTMLGFISTLLTRIEKDKPLSTVPLYADLSYVLVQLQFNVPRFLALYSIINKSIVEFLKEAFNRKNTTIELYINQYYEQIAGSLVNLDLFLKGLRTEQIVQLISDYGPSLAVVKDSYSSREINNDTIYSLFGEDNYWEVQSKKYKENPLYGRKIYTILNDVLYVLNKDISRPSTEFDREEWSEYTSKYLNKEKTFNNRLRKNVNKYVVNALEEASDINGIISDSKETSLDTGLVYDEKDLSLTFGGSGKGIVDSIISLKTVIKYFGNKQASPVGDIDYIASFCEYLYSGCYGRSLAQGFSSVSGINLFGNFDLIYYYTGETNKIAGLKFIERFKYLRSFKQNLTLGPGIETKIINEGKVNELVEIMHNPIYSKYSNGIRDRFVFNIRNPYTDNYQYSVDVILFGLETITNISSNLGDAVNAVTTSLDRNGELAGYEGLGSIYLQMQELSNVFIPKPDLESLISRGEKVLPGLNGLTTYLLRSYQKLTAVVPDIPFTGESLRKLTIWSRKVQKYLERIIDDIETIGYQPGTFIPNISFKNSLPDRETLIDRLRSLNFQESEINEFISAETLEELLLNFAPLSDSRDQASFFKGYELSQLIYEFGGESAVDAYLGYLYSPDDKGLINLLTIALKDQSKATTYNASRFGKLVGLLVSLTFAIDPKQLELFKSYLSGNRLTFFESISFLLKNKERNILLNKEEVNLLNPVSKSLIFGKSGFDLNAYSIDYQTANEHAPLALKQYTEILDKNLGDASTNFLQNLYDKSEGLTVKELIKTLNPESFHTDLGQLLEGYEGGRLTKILNYAYLSGVLHKIGYYNNSYQTPNFFVMPRGPFNLTAVVETLKSLVLSLDLTITNFINTLEDDFSQDVPELYSFNNIINSYNKETDTLSRLVREIVPINGDLGTLGEPSLRGTETIMGSPGIGNSPIPESIPKENSITPEQANILSPQIITNFSFLAPRISKDLTENNILDKFTKVIEDNRLITGISPVSSVALTKSGVSKLSSNPSKQNLASNKQGQVSGVESEIGPGTEAAVNKDLDSVDPLLFISNDFKSKVETSVVANLIKDQLITEFDAIRSCKKFGGTNCEKTIEKIINSCGEPTNKAIYSERDDTPFTPISNSGILIDRPYGKNSEIKLSNVFLPNMPDNRPLFFNVFDDKEVRIGLNGEPILSELKSEPIVFTKKTNDSSLDSNSFGINLTTSAQEVVDPKEKYYSLYYNSEFGLIEAIKAKWEKDGPFKCALLEDPYAYQACMNLLKCKRFIKEDEVAFLKFCPKTLAGGLSK